MSENRVHSQLWLLQRDDDNQWIKLRITHDNTIFRQAQSFWLRSMISHRMIAGRQACTLCVGQTETFGSDIALCHIPIQHTEGIY